MHTKSIQELNQEFEFEFEKIIKTIKKGNARKILLQFPDGLKPYSTTVADYLKKSVKDTEFFIWFGSCFGACDIPQVNEKEFDLIVQFGHSKILLSN
ncbi:MAG: diphthamide synthesis protein [Nanoarchaeota archaeon]|nr:diphthamide synthesis protein [Nanoarchaeota archaeon]